MGKRHQLRLPAQSFSNATAQFQTHLIRLGVLHIRGFNDCIFIQKIGICNPFRYRKITPLHKITSTVVM